MKTFIVEVEALTGTDRKIITVEAMSIEEARTLAVKRIGRQYPDTEWTDASSAEVTSDSTHTS